MSMAALLMAVRDQLRTKLNLGDEFCEIMPSERPPGKMVEKFISVHFGSITDAGSHGLCLDRHFGADITLTWRIRRSPTDRVGQEVLAKAVTGLFDLADQVVYALHMDPNQEEVRHRANEIIGPNAEGFTTCLQMQPIQYRGPVGPGWFGSKNKGDAGVVLKIPFGKARRVQKLQNMQTTRLSMDTPETTRVNREFDFTIQAIDSNGNLFTSYNGVANLSSSDPDAVLPDFVTFTNGVATVTGAILSTVGEQTFTAIDSVNQQILGISDAIDVVTNTGNYAGNQSNFAGSENEFAGAE